jgi:glycosyltransferase involved in cell wall biosynthesis
LAEANIVVCPGGPAGLQLLEAAAMKKSIVTVNLGWASDALGDAAFFVPLNSPIKVAEAVVYALENREVSNTLAEAAYKKVKLERSWETVTQKHLELYNTILNTQAT